MLTATMNMLIGLMWMLSNGLENIFFYILYICVHEIA